MKRTVMTAVFMIILAVFFTSCGWEVDIRNPEDSLSTGDADLSTPEEGLSTEDEEPGTETGNAPEVPEDEETYEAFAADKYEAGSFFYSDEGYEAVEFFVSWLGAKDFESTEEITDSYSLWYFMPELYEKVGEEALCDGGNSFIVPKELGNKYLVKYFGVDYEPSVDEPNFDPETGNYKLGTTGCGAPYKLLDFDHPRTVQDNRILVDVLMVEYQDELGKHFATSEMVFDVMQDEEGKFLRLVSNKVTGRFDEPDFEQQAQSLTNQIVQICGKKRIEEYTFRVTKEDIQLFIIKTPLFSAMNPVDENAPYIGVFKREKGFIYHYPVSEMDRVAFEVFGIEDISWELGRNFEYDAEKDEYTSGLEWGMEQGSMATEMTTTADGNIYTVDFTLLYIGANEEGDPEWLKGERYKMQFELVNGEFLRYLGFEKA